MFHVVFHVREDDLAARAAPAPSDRRVSARWVFILWLFGFVGLGGLHRLYLRQPRRAMLYLLTLSLFGVGLVWDLVFLPALVSDARRAR